MPIVEVRERRLRAGSFSFGDSGVRQYTRVYHVESDDKGESEVKVRQATGLPRKFDSHPDDTAALVREITIEQRDDQPLLWDVEVLYATEEGAVENDPLNDPADLEWSFNNEQLPVSKADFLNASLGLPVSAVDTVQTDVPITTSAGIVINPPHMENVPTPVLRITRNETAFNASFAIAWQNSLNDRAWNNVASRQAKLNIPSAQRLQHPDPARGFYWRITYEIAFRQDEWTINQLDAGFYSIGASGPGFYSPIPDDTNNVTQEPIRLDGKGDVLSTGVGVGATGAVYRVYRSNRTKERNFDDLNLI